MLAEEVYKLKEVINKLELSRDSWYYKYLDLLGKHENLKIGTPEWLAITEAKYGGISRNICRNKVSEYDPRTEEQLKIGGMVGGDRMNENYHNYAPYYSKYLEFFNNYEEPMILVEFGILKGTGLAIWSDLFPKGRIIGLDIDLRHINNNMENLKQRGAFINNNIELYEFDQFKDNIFLLGDILKGSKINIAIDDGLHLDETIIKTIQSTMPYLANDFVYFIEDNKNVYKEIVELFPELIIHNYDELTVICSNKLALLFMA